MPFLFCQAAAIVTSHLLHALDMSSISTFAVFVWFALATVGAVLFYHFVKVSPYPPDVLILSPGAKTKTAYGFRVSVSEPWAVRIGILFPVPFWPVASAKPKPQVSTEGLEY